MQSMRYVWTLHIPTLAISEHQLTDQNRVAQPSLVFDTQGHGYASGDDTGAVDHQVS